MNRFSRSYFTMMAARFQLLALQVTTMRYTRPLSREHVDNTVDAFGYTTDVMQASCDDTDAPHLQHTSSGQSEDFVDTLFAEIHTAFDLALQETADEVCGSSMKPTGTLGCPFVTREQEQQDTSSLRRPVSSQHDAMATVRSPNVRPIGEQVRVIDWAILQSEACPYWVF